MLCCNCYEIVVVTIWELSLVARPKAIEWISLHLSLGMVFLLFPMLAIAVYRKVYFVSINIIMTL